MLSLAAYLCVSGSIAGVAGWVALNSDWASRHLGLRGKAIAGSSIAGLAGLLNVFIIARLMFVSTSHDLYVLAAAVGFSTVLTMALSLHVGASIAQRVGLISEAVRALATGAQAPDLGQSAVDEVARLAADVETLSARLATTERERARLDQQRIDLTAAISHDLRTPLASVRAMAEALAEGVVDDEGERKRYYALMGREVERLDRMIGDLFDLAQLDAGALRLEKRLLPLHEIVAEVVEGMKPQAVRQGIDLRFECGGTAMPDVALDGARFERSVANLIRNAIEHTPPGGSIVSTVTAEPGWVVLRVSDTGEGFEAPDAAQVWDRFYRGNKARSRSQGSDGAGLGLSIVRGFVEAHGGKVECDSVPGRGATFTLRLPAG
jgi:signal transduction histidine kinase